MGRRPNGQGSVYLDSASGLWCASVVVDGRRKYLRSKRQDVVLQKLDAVRRQVADGLPVPSDTLSVSEFLTEWLAARRSSLAPQTFFGYERRVRRSILPHLGRIRLTKLDRMHIQNLYELLEAEGLSAQTVNHVDAVLKKALKDGVRWGRVARNVAELVEPPRVRREARRFLNASEARSFLEAARGDAFEGLYILAIGTGLRRGELLGLHWRDVDLSRGLLSVNWTQIRDERDGLSLDSPKTEHSRRRLRLDADVVEALRAHHRRQADQRLKAGEAWEENDLVFPNEIGRPLNPSNLITRSFWPLRDRAGLGPGSTATGTPPALRFHDLRHTAGSLMLEAGVPLKIVSERLGHSNINITADIYLHVTEGLDEAAAVAVGDLLRRARSDTAPVRPPTG